MPTLDGPRPVKVREKEKPDTLDIPNGTKFAIVAVGVAVFLASRGRITSPTERFITYNATKGIVGLGGLYLATRGGHQPSPRDQIEQEAVANLLKQVGTLESPSGKYVFYVNKKTGEKTRIPAEEFQRLIDTGTISVKNAKTGKKISALNMLPFWNADP